VTATVIQNGNAYEEGLKEFWDPIKAYWADGSAAKRNALAGLVTLETTKFQYTDGVRDVSRIDPDNWLHDQTLLDRPGSKDIQLDLFRNYGTNVGLYRKSRSSSGSGSQVDCLGRQRQDLPGGRRARLSARPWCHGRLRPADLLLMAERWRPLRAYAAMLLWFSEYPDAPLA
jgi:hypothetical protein